MLGHVVGVPGGRCTKPVVGLCRWPRRWPAGDVAERSGVMAKPSEAEGGQAVAGDGSETTSFLLEAEAKRGVPKFRSAFLYRRVFPFLSCDICVFYEAPHARCP